MEVLMAKLKVTHYDDVPTEEFPGGAQYRTLVEEKSDDAELVTGIQVSPPGYSTPNHSHPYVEIITVIEGHAEAWSDGSAEVIHIGPGGTVIFPANECHGFRVVGESYLKTYGIHISKKRIVEMDGAAG